MTLVELLIAIKNRVGTIYRYNGRIYKLTDVDLDTSKLIFTELIVAIQQDTYYSSVVTTVNFNDLTLLEQFIELVPKD